MNVDDLRCINEVAEIDQLVGVFGHPIGHSMSPAMHNAAFDALGLPFYYGGFNVHPEQLEQAVAGIQALGFAGINVTIPHKVPVMDYLDWIDDTAQLIGAVNTIVNKNGRLLGFNTDGDGYLRSLIEEASFDPTEKRVLVLGASGAARGIITSLLSSGIACLAVANRTEARARELVTGLQSRQLELLGRPLPAQLELLDWSAVPAQTKQFDVVINCTSAGMWPNVDAMTHEGLQFHDKQIISDIVYNPLETKLLALAKQQGAVVHYGTGMFVYQGAIAFEKWTGHPAPVKVMRQVVEDRLRAAGRK
ncbi:MAG: shikimate dehydrogenase [Bacilli bacterium]|nr:shikimate dehydrogenase [Bacilli bacterium]